MPAATQLLAWAATALGTGAAGTLVSGWLNRRKTGAEAVKLVAEARKVEAEAGKADADADATRADTADHLIALLRSQVDRQAAELAELRAALAEVRRATEECEAHRVTDRQELAVNRAELAELKAANAGLRTRLEELEHDLHRREARTSGDGR